MLIPELCYGPIFKTLAFLKLMNVKLYGLVNIETTRIDELVTLLTGVITTGLSALPTFVDTGAGYVKFIGDYNSTDILLITLARFFSKNEV